MAVEQGGAPVGALTDASSVGGPDVGRPALEQMPPEVGIPAGVPVVTDRGLDSDDVRDDLGGGLDPSRGSPTAGTASGRVGTTGGGCGGAAAGTSCGGLLGGCIATGGCCSGMSIEPTCTMGSCASTVPSSPWGGHSNNF